MAFQTKWHSMMQISLYVRMPASPSKSDKHALCQQKKHRRRYQANLERARLPFCANGQLLSTAPSADAKERAIFIDSLLNQSAWCCNTKAPNTIRSWHRCAFFESETESCAMQNNSQSVRRTAQQLHIMRTHSTQVCCCRPKKEEEEEAIVVSIIIIIMLPGRW